MYRAGSGPRLPIGSDFVVGRQNEMERGAARGALAMGATRSVCDKAKPSTPNGTLDSSSSNDMAEIAADSLPTGLNSIDILLIRVLLFISTVMCY